MINVEFLVPDIEIVERDKSWLNKWDAKSSITRIVEVVN